MAAWGNQAAGNYTDPVFEPGIEKGETYVSPGETHV